MSKQKYYDLVDQLCAQLGVDDPKSKYDDCNLQVNGIDFTLTHGEEADPSGLTIYADFGEAPAALKTPIYVRLMETNFLMFGSNTPSFAFNMETGRIVQMLRLPSSTWNLESLIATMAHIAGYAKLWRESYFLSDEERGKRTGSRAKSMQTIEAR